MLQLNHFMVRTQVYLTEEQARDIKLQAKRENKAEAEVIRELVNKGLDTSQRANRETTGDALLRFAKLGEELQVQAPTDLSSRIDEYLYGENK
jgi:hypothetical protein